MRSFARILLACATLTLVPAAAPAQDVIKEVSAQRLEDILKGLNLEFTKAEPSKGVTSYDFKTKTRKASVRLLSFEGKDLMLQAELGRAELETVNKHNSAAKFSRARLAKLKGSEVVFLESNLDLRGGVTEDTIKHFINNFDEELSLWSRTTAPVVTEEETFRKVTPQVLEQILKEMKISFNKIKVQPGVSTYIFTRNNQPIALHSFEGGEDLMIDRQWLGKGDLAKINDWNVKRFFVRAVAYPPMGGKPAAIALESNLDCAGGVSESIIRNFINAFDDEVRRFDEYLKK
jgi:hypothetical protein